MAERVSKDPETNYTYLLTSEWNINPDQGLQDPFDIWAWQRFQEDDDLVKYRRFLSELAAGHIEVKVTS